jgi:hopanoid biosynthesis associated protein HpnK
MLRERWMIINGDDFGFSSGVNQGIIQAYQEGILTSTSLMVTGEAFVEAVSLAKANPGLAVGLHLVLGCGRAVLPPAKIPHLVDNLGYFPHNSVKAGLKYQFSRVAQQELRQEIYAQLDKFRQTGLPLSHVDGHLHHHVNPKVLNILIELATEFNIKVIRLPYEELSFTLKLDSHQWLSKISRWFIFSCLRHYGETRLATAKIKVIDRVYGLLKTGQITENYLLGLIPQIRANLVEIYAHPSLSKAEEPLNGPAGAGKLELEAMLSSQVRDIIEQSGFQLTNYLTLMQA